MHVVISFIILLTTLGVVTPFRPSEKLAQSK